MKRIKKFVIKYNKLGNTKLFILSLILSLVFSVLLEIKRGNYNFLGNTKVIFFGYFPLILINLTPTMLMLRLGSLKKIREKPRRAIYLILYFMIFVPILISFETLNGLNYISGNTYIFLFAFAINTISIVLSHVILIRYIFLDVILKKRKPTGKDTLLVLMTYITLGITFGFLHTLISLMSPTTAYSGIDVEMIVTLGSLKYYFRHIYYSFVTLTSLGFGDINPLTWIAQLTSVVEALCGVFLLSFSLGIILGTEAEEDTVKEEEQDKFKDELLKDIEELIDRKFSEMNISKKDEDKIRKNIEK